MATVWLRGEIAMPGPVLGGQRGVGLRRYSDTCLREGVFDQGDAMNTTTLTAISTERPISIWAANGIPTIPAMSDCHRQEALRSLCEGTMPPPAEPVGGTP
jgi:hypothetical protein